MAIIGIMRQSSPESEDYARINNRVTELESDIDNAIYVNREFDDTAGFWQQVKFDGFTDDAVIVHKKISTENYNNLEVTPNIITQSLVSYSADNGQNFTRMANSYHELIVSGQANVTSDSSSPNFTALGASAYNKSKGGVGVTAVTGRVEDEYISNVGNFGANKSCGGFFAARRNAPYSQGHRGTSYSIALEAQMLNAPANLNNYSALAGTDEYYGNDDSLLGLWDTWTNGFHEIVGGRRPVSAAIMINGFSQKYFEGTNNEFTLRNGTYNGIIIGASSMQIRGGVPTGETDENDNPVCTNGNSHETVAINTANWSKNKHGFYLLKHGYSGRILKAKSAALFETLGAKFFNPDGSMPFAISCIDEYTENENTVHGTPYLDFKIGSANDFVQDNIPLERPTDTTHARIGYVSTSNSMNVSSDGDIKFLISRDFSENTAEKTYSMTETDFSPSSPVNLGTSSKKWDNIYANADVITTSDRNLKTDIQDIDEKILKAWGKVNYKVFKFKNGSRKHIGVIAQDIDKAFADEGLDARDFGLFCEDTDENGNTILGVRYSECLALECAYIRSKIGS